MAKQKTTMEEPHPSDARIEKYISKLNAQSDVRMEKYLALLSRESDTRLEKLLADSDKRWQEANGRLEKERAEQKKETERYIGGLTEHFEHSVAGIGEQVSGIMITLGKHSTILESHTEMIGELKVDVAMIREDVKDIKTELKEKASRKSLIELDKRVFILETQHA